MVLDKQKKALQQELADLLKEREACFQQYRTTIDESNKVILKRKLDDYDKKIAELESQLSKLKRDIPPLLPHLCNRTAQRMALEEAFDNFTKQGRHYPLVCIFHGDEMQSHYDFLRRMREIDFRNLLKLDSKQPKIREYHLLCPSEFKDLNDDLQNQLRMNLLKVADQHYRTCLREEISPVIVYTNLLTYDCQQSGVQILDKLLKFWQNLYNRHTDNEDESIKKLLTQHLIICIHIQYKTIRPVDLKSQHFLKTIFMLIGDFFQKNRYQQSNRKIREYVEFLNTAIVQNPKEFKPLSVVILPELKSIKFKEILDWLHSYETKEYVGEENIQKLIKKVRNDFNSIYKEMPMENLVTYLTKLLDEELI